MLLVGSCHLSSDSVQISLSLRRQFAAPILVLFHHFQPLQGLEDPPGHALGASAEVAGHDTVPLAPPIDLGHGANPSATREVQVPCRGSSSCVEPVLIVGSKFFMLGQLDGVHPFSFPDFLRKAARALTNSCWFMSFTVTPGIVRPPCCQPGAKSLSFKNRYIYLFSCVESLLQ